MSNILEFLNLQVITNNLVSNSLSQIHNTLHDYNDIFLLIASSLKSLQFQVIVLDILMFLVIIYIYLGYKHIKKRK